MDKEEEIKFINEQIDYLTKAGTITVVQRDKLYDAACACCGLRANFNACSLGIDVQFTKEPVDFKSLQLLTPEGYHQEGDSYQISEGVYLNWKYIVANNGEGPGGLHDFCCYKKGNTSLNIPSLTDIKYVDISIYNTIQCICNVAGTYDYTRGGRGYVKTDPKNVVEVINNKFKGLHGIAVSKYDQGIPGEEYLVQYTRFLDVFKDNIVFTSELFTNGNSHSYSNYLKFHILKF